MPPIRIAIVENEVAFAEAIRLVLNSAGTGFFCTDIFTKGEAALHKLPELAPDIVLMDIGLGEWQLSGIDLITRLKPQMPATLFMVLTVYEDHKNVFDALSAGALGYVLKTAKAEKIIEALRELHEGGAPMSPSIARKVAASFGQSARSSTPDSELLTAREREVIERISQGKLEKEVAADLFISLKTVKSHITNIYAKLQVHTRVEALNKYFGR